MVNCPLCGAAIDADEEELDEGDPLLCEECGASLTVTGLNPLEISPEADLDEDDEDFDENDDLDDDEEDEDDDEDKD